MKKQEKKFVLVALALLAITGLLALAGCKNDTVPEPTRYTVKFETAHGTAPADITVVSGTKLTAEQLKVLDSTDNYIFEGWYDGETKAEGGTYTVTKDVTLVAKWKPRDQVQINFKVSGNTVELSSEPAEATIHYTTDGTEPKESWDEYANPIEISSKITIKAYAEKLGELKESDVVEKTYLVVTFNADGGSTVASQTVESGQKATRPAADPTLEGSWFLGWYSDEGLANEFDFNTPITTATTVYAKWSYKLHTKPTTLTKYPSPHAPSTGTWTYVEFGDWPQIILKGDVKVDESEGKEMGLFTYYLGSDGNHYVKAEENAYGAGYKYSDDSDVNKKDESGSPSTRWFKVEPIVWRVLTENYIDADGKSTGNALLLAESILTGGIPYYVDTSSRRITEKEVSVTVYPNNWQYSTIRAWLNGSYVVKGDGQENDTTYTGKGFLQTAFTESAQTLIAETTVDNTADSTTDEGSNLPPATDYACANTKDKIFLLSEQEATTLNSGFAAYDAYGKGSTRIRVTTDYAKATGAYQSSTEGYGGWWWLRSPYFGNEYNARVIINDGDAINGIDVDSTDGGVVPALSISLEGN